ncbi:MAG: hypothetical protein FWF31_11700, partial [Desulfobulbus sp.]|nr:hypothetical protein [Desulfobulbus sp.]
PLGFKVILALNHAAIKELCDKGTIQMSLFDEKNIIEVTGGNLRYCLCKNPLMAAKETAARKPLPRKTTEELDQILAHQKVEPSTGRKKNRPAPECGGWRKSYWKNTSTRLKV